MLIVTKIMAKVYQTLEGLTCAHVAVDVDGSISLTLTVWIDPVHSRFHGGVRLEDRIACLRIRRFQFVNNSLLNGHFCLQIGNRFLTLAVRFRVLHKSKTLL